MARLIARMMLAWCAAWLCAALAIPFAVGYQEMPKLKTQCPYLIITHGVGSDLRTWVRARDVCAT